VDFDDDKNIVGVDIDRASKVVDLQKMETVAFPLKEEVLSF